MGDKKINGEDVFNLMLQIATYWRGKPFTVHNNMDSTGITNLDKVKQLGNEEITKRLQPVHKTWEPLKKSLYKTGVLFKDDKKGAGIKTEWELTEEQTQLYKKVYLCIEEVDTLINL